MDTMRAVIFAGPNDLRIVERPRPTARYGEAVIRITTTTICTTDVHIVRGEYPARPGLVLGHEPVGVIAEIGDGLHDDYYIGQRVIVGAVTPCGTCYFCLNDASAQCCNGAGGWRFGRSIDGAWAEYLLVPDARVNLAPIPDDLSDEDVLLLPDVFSAGLAGAERGGVRVGDTVAVFAQGPLGLCATAGARLLGASLIIGVDALPERLDVARRLGATATIDYRDTDPVLEIRHLTGGRGVDVAIEALGHQRTFEAALRAVRRGGTLSSLGIYSGKLDVPWEPFFAGIRDQRIVTTLCPGGKERMRRLMALVSHRRVDLTPLITHRFALDEIHDAFELFSHQDGGVLKVALHPAITKPDHMLVPAHELVDECC